MQYPKPKIILALFLSLAFILSASAVYANLNFGTTSITSSGDLDLTPTGQDVNVNGKLWVYGQINPRPTIPGETGVYSTARPATAGGSYAGGFESYTGSSGNFDMWPLWVYAENSSSGTAWGQGIFIYDVDNTGGGTISSYKGIYIEDLETVPSVSQAINYADKFIIDSNGSFQLRPSGAQPACNLANRFTFWTTAGGAGVKDNVQVCAKDVGDAYAWRTIY
jgi:hypothetical protein